MNGKNTIIKIVVVIAILGGLFAIISAVGFDSDRETAEFYSIQYDDYVDIDGFSDKPVKKVSGPLEIIRIDGKDYIHGFKTGSGLVFFQDGSVGVVEVVKAKLDVYLLIGQSNAAQEIGDRNTADVPLPGTAYYYGTEEEQAYLPLWDQYGIHDMRKNGGSVLGSLEPSLSKELNRLTGHKILIVNGAIGGVSVSTYVPSGSSYNFAKYMLQFALYSADPNLFEPRICSYIWVQGEADSYMPVQEYKEYYLLMHSSLVDTDSEFCGGGFDAGFISKVRQKNGINSSAAQTELAEEYWDIVLATDIADRFTVENGLMLPDDLHYSQQGDNLLGAEIARSIYEKGCG